MEEFTELMKFQAKLLELLAKRLAEKDLLSSHAPTSTAHLLRQVQTFQYDLDAGLTFGTWLKRHRDVFNVELTDAGESCEVRILLRKLGPTEYVRYSNYILPAELEIVSSAETVEVLTRIVGDGLSLFNVRSNCMQTTSLHTVGWSIVMPAFPVEHTTRRPIRLFGFHLWVEDSKTIPSSVHGCWP